VRTKRETSFGVRPGNVISQSPDPGSKIAKGSTVTIYVSTGKPKSKVPDVRQHPLSDAIAALSAAGLTPKITYVHSPLPVNTVTGEFPAPGDSVIRGSVVHINVSTGPKQIQVPDVVGQPYANAAGALQGAGFQV